MNFHLDLATVMFTAGCSPGSGVFSPKPDPAFFLSKVTNDQTAVQGPAVGRAIEANIETFGALPALPFLRPLMKHIEFLLRYIFIVFIVDVCQ